MNTIKLFVLSFIVLFSFYSCENDNDEVWPDIPNSEITPISSKNKVIYEVNVRNYSSTGNFKGLENDLPRLKDVGVDILWLMPIHPIGVQNRNGSMGSPYSVKDYKAINPDYGTAADLKSLIAAAHAAGMEIWLDWVANHTAWDHTWVKSNIDFYASKDGQRPYSPNGWTDVVQLDFDNVNMRAAMVDAMKYWVKEFNIDGYRCDAATFIPLSFWIDARTEVDKIKKITWLCEGDNPTYMEAFDYDYAWGFNDALNTFGEEGNIPLLISECNKLFSNPAYENKGRMVYLANHDLNALGETEFTRYGNNLLPLTVLSFTIYDLPLINNAQEIGMNRSISLFDLHPIQWTPVNGVINNLFKSLTQLKRTQPALEDGTNRGDLIIYPTTNENIFVYSRRRGNNEVLVMLNLAEIPIKFRFTNSIPAGVFRNYLRAESVQFSSQDGVVLHPNGYAIFVK